MVDNLQDSSRGPIGAFQSSAFRPSAFQPSAFPAAAAGAPRASRPQGRDSTLPPPAAAAAVATADPLAAAASGLRRRLLLPLAAAVLLMVAAFVSVFVFETHQSRAHDIARTATSLETLLRDQSAEKVSTMRSLMTLVQGDPRLDKAMRERDRRALLDAAAPMLDQVRAGSRISHFYFILPDATTLLRVHAPDQHGDRIDRVLLQEAQRTGKPVWGNEQGPLGAFTLRAVQPWRSRGELIGYLEMGIEFEDLMHGIHPVLDAQAYLAIDKKFFNRGKWEQAQKYAAQPVPWDEFSHVVVVSRTAGAIPPPIAQHLDGLAGRYAKDSFEIAWDQQAAQAIVLPFADPRGELLGELIVLRDITAAAAQRRHAIAGVAALATLVGGLLMVLFHVLIGRAQHDAMVRTARLAEAQRVLTVEQLERQRAQRELATQRERNELLETRHHMFQDLVQAKRALESRTEELATSLSLLNATLDSTTDGILAPTFCDGTVRANAQLAHMWGLPQDMLARGIDAELFAYMARQVKHPEGFIAEVEDMYACPEAEAFDVLELKDGRIFERHVKPQRIHGKAVGIVINFRDVTDRRRVEAQLQSVLRGPAPAPAPVPAPARTVPLPAVPHTGPQPDTLLHDMAGTLEGLEACAGVIEGKVRSSETAALARAVQLIQQHAAELGDFLMHDVQGRQLPACLEDLAQALQEEQAAVLLELGELSRGVARLRQAVAKRLPPAGTASVVELIRLADLVDNALRMNGSALARHHVQVVKELAELPALPLDRHRLMLVLVTLIRNARHAMQAAAQQAPCLTLRVALLEGHMLRVEVQHNGEGTAPQDLVQLLDAGTTAGRDDDGFGLRSCVRAARDMGGTLTARSSGAGPGETFTLDLPVDALETVG
jgi:signal transduction histidine kinase